LYLFIYLFVHLFGKKYLIYNCIYTCGHHNIIIYKICLYIYIYYLDQKIPGIHSENSKYKLFIKSDIVPFKILPIDCNALMPTLDPALETFLDSIVGIAIRAIFDFSITSFRLLKHVPRNGFLTRANRKKSQGAISGEFDGC